MDTTRTTSWDDPVEIARDLRALPGLEFLRRLIARGTRVPVGVTLGFRLVEVGDGLAVFEAEAGPWAYNPIGSVHGGWYAAVLDAPLGCAIHTLLPAGVGYATLEMKVNVVRPVQPTPAFCAPSAGRPPRPRTAVTEARMEDAAGRLYAHATSTCLILQRSRRLR
jgi:uncharacterized protein (TIGR00369 family)